MAPLRARSISAFRKTLRHEVLLSAYFYRQTSVAVRNSRLRAYRLAGEFRVKFTKKKAARAFLWARPIRRCGQINLTDSHARDLSALPRTAQSLANAPGTCSSPFQLP